MSILPKLTTLVLTSTLLSVNTSTAFAADWLTMSDQVFAEHYVGQAFGGTPKDRYQLAWMLFARVNQQIKSGDRVVSKWEAWPSDKDTFSSQKLFAFGEKQRDDPHFVTSKKVLAGNVDTDIGNLKNGIPQGTEEVTRNQISYDYILGNGLNSANGVTTYLEKNNIVQMPIGSMEIKAKWLPSGTPQTEGAYTFEGKAGSYSLAGMHIMFKMAETPEEVYTSPKPSWFWTTFEFDKNPGLSHARKLIDQPHKNDIKARDEILKVAGLSGASFEMYSPNGTQISFEEHGQFKVLGHTMMESFASIPQNSPVDNWTGWKSSCHSCHAAASWDVKANRGNRMPMPVGNLSPELLKALEEKYVPVDFMWPIVFNAR